MLLCSLAMHIALALSLPLPLHAAAASSPSPSSSSSSSSESVQSTAGAATQPNSAHAGGSETSLVDTFGQTRLGQLAQGKKQVSLAEMKDPTFWIDTIKDLVVAVVGFVPRLLVSIIFLGVFWGVYRGLRRLLHAGMDRADVDDSIKELLTRAVKWAVMGFGVVIACNQIGIPIVAMLTGVSIIGLAVGFAAQETLANFIAGIVIFWDKPFRVGDIISVEGTFGEVQRVTFRSTRMITGDGEMVVMPNTAMLSKKLINNSAQDTVRVRVPIGIAYKESVARAREALLPLVTSGVDERIMSDPAPEVVVTACAESSVNLEMRFWIRDASQLRAMYFEVMEKAKDALDAAGIQIPFPHLQLFVEDTPAVRTTDREAPRIAA